MSVLLDKISACDQSLSETHQTAASLLTERKQYLALLRQRIAEIQNAEQATDLELSRLMAEKPADEQLTSKEAAKCMRIFTRLTLAQTKRMNDEWRVTIGKFVCGEDVSQNWEFVKQAINQLNNL